MAHWVVLAQFGHGDQYRSEEAARFECTPDEARARLYELACTHRPRHGLRQKRP
ncbi:hypothetical protein ACIF83_34365 [Streptomyces sp. NPDC085866]|uniref:hypothetical protein n=1 Tax=Streptomyces sp. NPDC085866 TaxID=3365736 RepID=UPI0037CF2234